MRAEGRALATLARLAAEAAAAVIREAEPQRASLEWHEKGPTDFVTKVDLGAEAAALGVIRAAEPGATILAEESGKSGDAALTAGLSFVVDPLDGTTNFIHGFPEYAVSIGVLLDGALVAGVVLNVARNECFSASAGGGAWIGDSRLHVSPITTPARALIGTGFPFKTPAEIPVYCDQMARVMAATSGIRRAGSAAIDLAHVAAGRLDGFWENTLAPWDVAAGILLIREAGGICTDADGRASQVQFGSFVTGNPAMHAWLLNTIRVS